MASVEKHKPKYISKLFISKIEFKKSIIVTVFINIKFKDNVSDRKYCLIRNISRQ